METSGQCWEVGKFHSATGKFGLDGSNPDLTLTMPACLPTIFPTLAPVLWPHLPNILFPSFHYNLEPTSGLPHL